MSDILSCSLLDSIKYIVENVKEQAPVRPVSKKIGRKVASQLDAAKKYYWLLSVIYDIHLTPMEIALLAHTALWGTISTPPAQKDFLKHWSSCTNRKTTSKASLNNVVSQLQQKGLLVKDSYMKIRVNPQLGLRMGAGEYKFIVNLEIKEGMESGH